ncbi:hypothetical protein CVT24_007060 [Panaeolus cyanescens]|uniref:Uncharacterized protein n=1 Tax=Panaeolus cyanescens TaxID=181874 RepID=A0A409VJR6_9AGAR|nr:hypothetical protein CVT24_007060 [Panaeolus cyanescens]
MDPYALPNGRLQVVNGKLFYSPNCVRTLSTIPDPDVNGVEALRTFLPTSKEAASESFSERMDRIASPKWWSLAWGWTAFIPIFPTFTGSTLSILRQDLLKKSTHERLRHQLSGSTIEALSNLEQDLYQAAHVLSLQLQISVLKPSHPWIFGYRRPQSSFSKLQRVAQESRDWFSIWVGLLSFLISETEEEQVRKRGFPAIAIMSWQASLKLAGFQTSWVDGLNRSLICDFDSGISRIGTLVDLEEIKIGDPCKFVARLKKFHIPVWYHWSPKYEGDVHLSPLAPPPSHVQILLSATVPSPMPSTHLSTLASPASRGQSLLSETAPPPIPPADTSATSVADSQESNIPKWKLWLQKKEERNRRLMSLETEDQRAARLQREQNPPTSSAKVFIWERDSAGQWNREIVGKKYRRDTLTDFTPAQKVYDSFANEWDCCTDLAPGEEVTPIEEENDDVEDVYDPWTDEGSDPVIAETPSAAQKEDSVSQSNLSDHDQFCAIQADASPILSGSLDAAEEYILRVLRQYYGYTPALPAATPVKSFSDKVEAHFLKFVGIPLKILDRELFQRPTVISAVMFFERLVKGQPLLVDEFDLSRNHREAMIYQARLAAVKIIKQDNGNLLYMLDFGPGRNTTSWRLTLLTAMHTLMVCRLPGCLDEKDIALYLVHRGIPFKTLQESTTLNRMPNVTTPARLIPHRPEGYSFTKMDYQSYLEGLQDFLIHRRARAALLSGGYPWRLAMMSVSPHIVLDGPTGWSTSREDMFVVRLDSTEYVDDAISELELDLLCGVNECFTGNGFQTAKKSFFPLLCTFAGSGQDYGRWTMILEFFFKRVHEGGLEQSEGNFTTFRQPLTITKWRDSLRGAGDFRRGHAYAEKLASSFIANFLSTTTTA